MPIKDPEENRKYQREWARKNRATLRKYQQNLRLRVLDFLGGKCVYCNCDEPKALEINHKEGGGYKERNRRKYKRSSKGYYLDILAGRRKTDDLELTCAVCNAWHKLVKLDEIPDQWTISWHKSPE